MKRRWYRILSVLLTVTMVAGLFPAEVSAQEPETEIVEEVSENDAEDPYADTVSENEDTVSENDAEENDADTVSDNDAGESDALVSGSDDETPDEQETEDAEAPDESDDEEVIDYGTDEEAEEPVLDAETYDETIEVSSWEELSAAFGKSEAHKTLYIKLMKDLYMDGSGLSRDAYYFQSYDVFGHVTLDFNGHTLSGKLDAPTDNKLVTYTFLQFYLSLGPYEDSYGYAEAPFLTFDDTVGGGGVRYEASTYIDYPCEAVDVKMHNTYMVYFNGQLIPQTSAYNNPYSTVTVNGGEFYMVSSITKFSKGSRRDYSYAGEESGPWGFPLFMRCAFGSTMPNTIINGGTFTSVGIDHVKDVDVASRELSGLGIHSWFIDGLFINGGVFQSGGYAAKMYCAGRGNLEDVTDRNEMPQISGGVFKGGICFTNKDFYYADENINGEEFIMNRNISASMLFDENTRLFVGEKEKNASDLKWRNLETQKLIEAYPADHGKINDVLINNVSQIDKDSLAYRTNTSLSIQCIAQKLPGWTVYSNVGDVYLKNEYSVYKSGETTPVWSSEGLGYKYKASYKADEAGEYTLVLKHKVTIGDRVIAEDSIEKQLTIADKIAIKNIDVNLMVPVAGATPTNAVPVTEHITSTKTSWNHVVDGKEVGMSASSKFVAGEKYTAWVWLKAEDGYVIPDDAVVKFNGTAAGVLSSRYSEAKGVWDVSFEALENYVIDSIDVSLPEPVAGAKPADAVSTTDHVTVTYTDWKNVITDRFLSENETFVAGQAYRVGVIVLIEDGYQFSVDSPITFNKSTEGYFYAATNGYINFYTIYTVPEEKTTSIDTIHAVVIAPVAGANPQEAVCKTPFITFDENSWICLENNKLMKDTDTFEAGKTYELQVAAEPASGYSLADDTAFIINNSIAGEVIFLEKDYGAWYADFTADGKVLDSIAITTAPTKTTYVEDELFDPAGMVVTAKYIDNTTAEVSGYTYSPDYSLKTTDKEITVSYTAGGITKTATQAITVNEAKIRTLESIVITTVPAKTAYVEGETFDPAGMVVTAKYDDNTTQEVTGYTYTPDGALTLADKEITVSYTEGSVTKTAKQAITVKGSGVKMLSSIAVTTAPAKTTYSAGETFEPAGMVVTATYNDKSTAEVNMYTYQPMGALKASDTEVTISYTEGSITATAKQAITVIDVNESLYVSFTEGDSFVYTGAKITPAIAVMYRGKALVEGVDYTVKYKNNVKTSVGATKLPTVTVTGKTVSASGSRTFTITRKDIDDPDVTAAGITVAKGKTASPVLFYAGRKLGKNDINNPDAKVKFETDGTITIEGKGNFTGKRTIDVKVVDEKKIQVTAFNPVERIYNGLEQPLAASELTVVSGSTTLELGKDFEINYPADIASAGTVKITIVGIGEYSGSVSKSYKISPCTAGINVDVPASVQYKAGGATPEVTVTNGTDKLIAGRDYTLKYSNNKAANGKKPASVKVTFKGSYKGAAAVTKDFSITALDISTAMPKIYGDEKAYIKSGKYLKTPYVEVNGTLLTAKDMDVTYKIDGKDAKAGDKITDDMMSAGKVTVEVTVSGKGNYTGTVIGSYTISKAEKSQDISKAGVKLDKKSYAFTGEKLKPVVTVQIGKGANAVTLKEGVDYKVEYFANVNKGKASLVITGLGDSGTGTTKYYGSKKVSFKIGKGVFNWL